MDVQIVLGSSSDMKLAEDASKILTEFNLVHSIEVCSAHRTPEKLDRLIHSSKAKIFIAIAGLSAALPGTIAARTTKPVIAVPAGVKLSGLDALLSSMQMPTGIPVASVGVDSAKNAALLAVQILALHDKKLAQKWSNYRAQLKKK